MVRIFLHSTIFATLLMASFLSTADSANQDRVDRLHRNAIVIDAHSDYLDRSAIDKAGLDDDSPGSQTTLSKLEQGEVDAQFFSVFVPPAYRDYGYANRTYELIDRMQAEIQKNPLRIELATTSQDIERLAKAGKVAALIGIEGGHSIENSLAHLRNFHRLGVRYMTLTWANTNDWADSSGDTARWGGLNGFGIKVVKEMNRLGMMIDISHVSDDTFWGVMEHSSKPVIASHSLTRDEMNSKRNMSDEMIKAIAKNNGVIQVSFYSQYVDQAFADAFDSKIGEYAEAMNALGEQYLHDPVQLDIEQWSLEKKVEFSLTPPNHTRVVDHIEHIIQVAGVDYVGLGSDYDGMGAPPKNLEHVGKIKVITAELVERGYTDQDITKILGGNLIRVMRANQSDESSSNTQRIEAKKLVEKKMDDFFHAADQGDKERYLNHFTKNGVFMGTDDWERWPYEEFSTYVNKAFKDGKGWSYKPIKRFIDFNTQLNIAWVDEIVESKKWGRFRGTAVLEKTVQGWKLAHYSLSKLIPNESWEEVSEITQKAFSERTVEAGVEP